MSLRDISDNVCTFSNKIENKILDADIFILISIAIGGLLLWGILSKTRG